MSGSFRFLSLVQPFMSVLPEVAQAERKPSSPSQHRKTQLYQQQQLHSQLGATLHRSRDWEPLPGEDTGFALHHVRTSIVRIQRDIFTPNRPRAARPIDPQRIIQKDLLVVLHPST